MLEQHLITHCSPTLAGLKTGSLFCFPYPSELQLQAELSRCRPALCAKGVLIRVLRRHRGRALLYVYRPADLDRDFRKSGVRSFLQQMGYAPQPEKALRQLEQRLAHRVDCPHEIGLFLGYPLSDVVGFILNRGQNCKCTGCWKVYSNEAETRRRFAQFKRCQQIYAYQFQKGRTLSQLTVSGVPLS